MATSGDGGVKLSLSGRIIRVASAVRVKAGVTQKRAQQELLLQSTPASPKGSQEEEQRRCLRRTLRGTLKLLVACAVPLIEALKAVGFRWADEGNAEFSTIVPLIFGCALLGLAFFLTLLLRHGLREVRELADWRYLGFLVPSAFRTGLFVGANWALWHGTSATVLVMVMKSSLVPGVFGEMWLTGRSPWVTHLWTIGGIMLCIVNYTLSAMDSAAGFSNEGLLFCVIAAQCDFFGGFLLEAGIRLRPANARVSQEAEKVRCQLVNELFKLPVYVVLLLALDYDFVESGLVRGWNAQIVVGAVVTIPFYVVIYNYSCIANGTLQTNIFSSVDVGVTCVLEHLLFGDPVTASQALVIGVITLLILTYSTLVVDLRRKAIEAVREYSSSISSLGPSPVPSLRREKSEPARFPQRHGLEQDM